MYVRVGIDSGGTFTDAVAVGEDGSVRVAKVPSTPADPALATAAAFRAVCADAAAAEVRHGTTVPTNALLEGAGARVVLVTTAGFADVVEIGRQQRPDLYDAFADRPAPLVPRELRVEVAERISHAGEVLTPLDGTGLRERVGALDPDAVAVALLHAYADPAHEQAVAGLLAGVAPVVCSGDVAPEFREYERVSTTVLHAYLGPGTAAYLDRLAADPGVPARLLLMRSAGGLAGLADLARRPADALLSGPAAGALAAAAVAEAAGWPEAVAFDMGGTSTDVCLITRGRADVRTLTTVGGYPCLAPALAVHTVGAGGGSIATVELGGALVVGPASAGADPGPACYGRGGRTPTVTDADVVLGRVRSLVGGDLPLDVDAATAACDTLGPGAAQAVVDVVEANMEQALREVSVHRGIDPAGLAVVAFGGAGGLHAAALVRALGARAAVVPPRAGLLSAVGLLAAPVRADRSRTDVRDAAEFDAAVLEPLAGAAAEEVRWAGAPAVARRVDCRYRGQSHEIGVDVHPGDTAGDVAERFHAEHETRNGYRRDGAPVEVVTWRASAEVASPVAVADVLRAAGAGRDTQGPGPLVITEDDHTVFVPEDFTVRVDGVGNYVLEPR